LHLLPLFPRSRPLPEAQIAVALWCIASCCSVADRFCMLRSRCGVEVLVIHDASGTSFMRISQANFSPFVGSQRPSCAGPFVGRALPDDVGTAPVPNLIPTSGVHMPDGGMLALVGFGAVKGVSACASAPYCGFCASTFFCCCSDSDVACCRLREFIRVAKSLRDNQLKLDSCGAWVRTYLSIADASDCRW